MAFQAGSAYIPVRPDFTNFHRDIAAQFKGLEPEAAAAGRNLGQGLGKGIKDGLGDPLSGPLTESTRRQETSAPRQGDQVAGAFARGFQDRLRAAFRSLPAAQIDADASPAQRRIAELRAEMAELSKKTIGVDIDAATAMSRLAEIKAELAAVGRNATVDVRADTAAAAVELSAIDRQVRELDGKTARVNVEASGGGLAALGWLAGGLAAAPAGGALLGGAGILGAGLLGAGAGLGGVATAALPAISRIKDALQQETQAQQASTGSAVAAQQRALQLAGAQQTLADAIRNQAYVHQQALLQVDQAEQQLSQAQVNAANAQRALTEARQQAARNLQDMKNSLVDAGFAVRQDEFAVQDAKTAWEQMSAAAAAAAGKVTLAQAAVQAALAAQAALGPDATDQARQQATQNVTAAQAALKAAQAAQRVADENAAKAKLAYEQAVQQLKEQQLQLQRLQADEKAAAKAGVDGSNAVTQARQRLNQANQQVRNSEQALAQARANVARADQQAAEAVANARRAVTAATLSGEQATNRLTKAVVTLTPAEKNLEQAWKGFTSTYKDWARSLEPDVLPVLADGLSLVSSQLVRADPLIRASAAAMRILEAEAKNALAGPFWSSFIADVSVAAPQAILDLGHIGGHVLEGLAGVFRAFLPYTHDLLTSIDNVATRFDKWGQQLGSSSAFGSFISSAKDTLPLIGHDLEAIASAALSLYRAAYPLGQLELEVIGPLAQGVGFLANQAPGLVQLGVAWYALVKINSALKLTATITGFQQMAVAEGAAGAGAVGLGGKLRVLGATMIGVEAEAVTTRQALLGLGIAAAGLTALVALPTLIGKIRDAERNGVQSTQELTAALTKLGQTGDFGGALSKEFQASGADALQGAKSIDEFTASARAVFNPSFADYVQHAGQQLFSWLGAGKTDLQDAKDKLKSLDDTLTAMVRGGKINEAAAAFTQLQSALIDSGFSLKKINEIFPEYTGLVNSATFKNDQFTQSVQRGNQELSRSAHAFADSESEIISFNQGLATANDLVNTNGKAFQGDSAQALANRGQLISLAGTVQNYADQLASNNQLTDANIKKLQGQRDQLIHVAEKFGLSKDAARTYVDQLLKIPKSASTSLTVDANGKFKMADTGGTSLQNLLNNLQNILTGGHAAGGLLRGSGSGRSDTLLTPTAPGEFVVNAPATSRYLPWLAAINDEGNAGTTFRGRGYAGGGLIGGTAHLPQVTDGYAGGGLLDSSYASSYNLKASAAESQLASATGAARKRLTDMTAFAVAHTAVYATALTAALQRFALGGGKAVAFAQAQLGKPYQWGATGPDTFDCSGLTMRAWEAAGKEIGRTTYDQIKAGRAGSRETAMPGDLHLPEAGHVMMFVTPRSGTGTEMIHAPHTGDHVRYAPFRGGGWVRLINTGGVPSTGSGGGGSAASQSPNEAQDYARANLGEFGWGSGEYGPLLALWAHESGWRWNALNPFSGAYGIPQALPASKMASAGSDWPFNAYTQVRWGLGYIQDRYGSPSGAWSHELSYNWYDQGGVLPPGPSLVYNGTGRDEYVQTHDQLAALLDGSSGGGSGTHYHAHFDGLSAAMIQAEVRAGIQAEMILAAQRDRTGRRR